MRINFNLLTSSSDWPDWVNKLQEDFLKYYHIDTRSDSAKVMLWSNRGCQLFVEWCRQQNYDITYWELDYPITKTEPNMSIAYGVDIDESCPHIVEYKLKANP